MGKYWLYLESYSFVFCETTKTLFYNSLSGAYFILPNNNLINGIVTKLTDPVEMYCTEISKEESEIGEIASFIFLLQNNFIGDVIDQKVLPTKPVIIYPQLRIIESIENLLKEQEDSVGKNIKSYLHKIIIQITDKCNLNCVNCNSVYKQVTTCNSMYGTELSFFTIQKLLDSIIESPVHTIFLKGGNPFLYTEFDNLYNYIELNKNKKFSFLCNNMHLSSLSEEMLIKLAGLTNMILIIQFFSCPNMSDFVLIAAKLSEYKLNYEYNFFYSNDFEYNSITCLCEDLSVHSYIIRPIVREGENINDDIYIDDEVIFLNKSSKKDIFRRQALNVIDFGTVNVFANGNVFANVNMPKLGNINDSSITELLQYELLNGHSWFRIRNQKPCNNCVYQWLCPSPSSYELVINKPNLCRVKQ